MLPTFAGFKVVQIGYSRYVAENYDNCTAIGDGHQVHAQRDGDTYTMLRDDLYNKALAGVEGDDFSSIEKLYPDTFLLNGAAHDPSDDIRSLMVNIYEDVQYARSEHLAFVARIDKPRHVHPILWQPGIKRNQGAWVELINPNPGQAMKFNRKAQEWV